MIDTAQVLQVSLNGAMLVLALAFALVLYRIVRGPSLPDRVIGLDVLNSLVVGVLVIDAIKTGHASFLPAGLVLALLAFLATVAFAYYLQRRPEDE
jgi:multicomponent Na+:H+ antiporter subunit F